MKDDQRSTRGFTLVEILIVIGILGILASVAVFAVRGVASRGEESSCKVDRRTVDTAVEVYFAQNATTTIVASGVGLNRYEQALVDDGLLTEPSTYFDVAADGTITTTGQPCP